MYRIEESEDITNGVVSSSAITLKSHSDDGGDAAIMAELFTINGSLVEDEEDEDEGEDEEEEEEVHSVMIKEEVIDDKNLVKMEIKPVMKLNKAIVNHPSSEVMARSRSYSCTECPKKFSRQSQLRAHSRFHHPEDDDEMDVVIFTELNSMIFV